MLHPLKPKLSTKSALIIFIVIWLIALGSSIPSLFFFDVYLTNDHVHQCLPYDDQKQQSNTSLSSPHDIYRVYIVYNIYSQYIIPFIIISCAYFRIGSHLYFSKPVGQTKYQEVIARNKRKVRPSVVIASFSSTYSHRPVIEIPLDLDLIRFYPWWIFPFDQSTRKFSSKDDHQHNFHAHCFPSLEFPFYLFRSWKCYSSLLLFS